MPPAMLVWMLSIKSNVNQLGQSATLMRLLILIFVVFIAVLQYPLWLGKGGWLRVWELDRQVNLQKTTNAELKERNDTLDAEVRDLKQGNAAIEERARSELGMIKQDEVFYQVMQSEFPSVNIKPAPIPVEALVRRP